MLYMQPYIGVTGFMYADEVWAVLGGLPYSPSRPLMVGVLASSKTLAGKLNRHPRRFPQAQQIAHIFVEHPHTLNFIHYSTDAPSRVCEELCLFSILGGARLHGFQLNIAWPDVREIEAYRKRHERRLLVLQIGRQALLKVDGNAKTLARKVRDYVGLIDGILLDESGGKGEPLHPDRARTHLEAIQEHASGISLGVAGGLCHTTLELLKPLLLEFPSLSIDAEGRLRADDDALDVSLAKRYCSQALQMFQQKEGQQAAP